MINLNGSIRIQERSILKFRSDVMGNKFLDNIRWLTEEEVFKELEDSGSFKVDLNKIRDELKDPDKDNKVRQDQLEYLKQKYLNDDEPIEYLDVRVPFYYKDVKYQSMDIKDYIAMVEKIEKIEELEVLEILKKRNIID